MLVLAAGIGYYWRRPTLLDEAKTLLSASSEKDLSSDLISVSPLGDLSSFCEISESIFILMIF